MSTKNTYTLGTVEETTTFHDMKQGQFGIIIDDDLKQCCGHLVLRLRDLVVDIEDGDVWRDPMPKLKVRILPPGQVIRVTVGGGFDED